MDEGQLALRLAAMVGSGVLLLGGIVWRDQARLDDGWLIVIGYGISVCASVGWWDSRGLSVAFGLAAVYRWRRNYVGRVGRNGGG
jgi:hypothetical protein